MKRSDLTAEAMSRLIEIESQQAARLPRRTERWQEERAIWGKDTVTQTIIDHTREERRSAYFRQGWL